MPNRSQNHEDVIRIIFRVARAEAILFGYAEAMPDFMNEANKVEGQKSTNKRLNDSTFFIIFAVHYGITSSVYRANKRTLA